jgi:hypothetical protein
MLVITTSESKIYSLLCFTFLLLRESIEFQHMGKEGWVVCFAGPPFNSALLLVSVITKLFEIIYWLKLKLAV